MNKLKTQPEPLPQAYLLGAQAYDRLIDDLREQRKRAAQSGIKPEWIRLPPPRQRCPWTQLSRTGMVDVIVTPALEGKIPVKVIKAVREGKIRGAVMIHFDSLMAYLNSLTSAPNDQVERQPPTQTQTEERNS